MDELFSDSQLYIDKVTYTVVLMCFIYRNYFYFNLFYASIKP